MGIGSSGLKIVETKKPPIGAKEDSLPLGIVRYDDGKGGYVSRPCKEGATVLTSIPLTDKLYFGGLNASTLPTTVQSSESAGIITDSGSGGSLVPGGALQNIPFQSTVPTEGVQLSSDLTPTNEPPSISDIDRQIQTDAQQNIQADPKLRDNAFQMRLCQEQGTCDVGTIESSNPATQGEQLRTQAQQAVRQDYLRAIDNSYGSGFAVDPLGDQSVARVSDPSWGARFYDSETGQPFLGKAAGETDPTLLTSDGKAIPTSGPVSEWGPTMASTLDSPTRFQAFEGEYFDNGAPPKSFTTDAASLPVGATVGDVVAVDQSGTEKVIPRDAFNAVRLQGDISTGAADTIMHIQDITNGKVSIDAPFSFPSETGVTGLENNPNALTQISSINRAAALDAVEQEVAKYPSTYWQNANPVNLYTYGYTPDAIRSGLANNTLIGGYSDNYTQKIWVDSSYIDPNNSSSNVGFSTTVDHELTHYNDTKLFGSDAQWGLNVYGAQYGSAYAGESGSAAILSGKLGYDTRPEGFVRDYGYVGGIKEDQATVVESMFKNYSAVENAAQTDPALATKVQLAKEGFSNMSNGSMNEAYWQNLKPIDPTFTLTPSHPQPLPPPTFLEQLFNAFRSGQ